MNFGFEQLIHPVSISEFFGSFFEKKPLCILRDSPDYYNHVLSFDDISRYFLRNDLTFPSVRLVNGGNYLSPVEYTASGVFGDVSLSSIVINRVLFDFFNSGYTISIGALEHSIDSLRRFSHNLYGLFHSHVGVSAFYTPSDSQAILSHYDSVDVFAIQLFGKKHWKVYDSPFHLPLINSNYDVSGQTPILDVVLSPGDMLYFPRGFVHEVKTLNVDSFHLSIGVDPFKWLDVLNLFLSNKTNLVSLRDTCFFTSLNDASVRLKLRVLFDDLLDFCSNIDLDRINLNTIESRPLFNYESPFSERLNMIKQ